VWSAGAGGYSAPVLPRALPAILRALLVVVACAAAARAAGAVLPSQPALVVALAAALMLPGWALAAAAGLGDRLDTVALLGAAPVAGLAAWVPALAAGLALGLSFDQVLALVALQTALLLALRGSRPAPLRRADLATLATAALVAALVSTRWQESLAGDEVFHLARVRKLLAVPHLSLDALSELAGGKPHAGYVVPLLHAVEAAALRLSGIAPATGFPDLVPAAVVLLVLTSFAAGRAVAGRSVGAATVALVLWGSVIGTHPDLGMASWPGPFTLLVLFPAGVLAITELVRTPHDRRLQALLAATALVVALVHVSYAVPLLALVVGTLAYTWRGLIGAMAAMAAAALVFAFVWWEALRGVPKPVVRAGPWQHATSDAFVMAHGHALALNARTITDHQIGFLLALLALVPLLIWRAPQFAYPAALMSGVLALVAVPGFVPLLNATVGIGQTHRFGAAIPWQVPAAVLAALVVIHANRRWLVPAAVLLAVAAAIGPSRIQSLWDVAPSLPTTPIAVAAVVGAGWYAARGLRVLPQPPLQAALLPTVAVALAAVVLSDPSSLRAVASDIAHGRTRVPRSTVPAAVVNWIDRHGGRMPVVLADELRSYRLGAYVDAYVVAVPEVRTRAEPASMPEQRRQQVQAFLSAATPESQRDALIRRYGVDIVIAPGNRASLLSQLQADPLLRRRLTVPSGGGGWVLFTVSR
jgi:hypothetical protein